MKNRLNQLLKFLNLTHDQEEFSVIDKSIEESVELRGTNLWILIFAIVIASIGLNMNSTAVIIGAMLISPLMGPINGIGYSIATYDVYLLKKSLKYYFFSMATGLVASYFYFLLTPIKTEYSELLSRTTPTIYDVIIAMFGGLAGIVALSSRQKGNVVPGVAIATALMPPLCTAGYGLSIGNWSYFLGALYLFMINSVFIALSAMIVSQLLKFPKKTFLLSKEIKNQRIIVAIIVTLTVLPSMYFGYTLVKKEQFRNASALFIETVSIHDGNFLLSHKINVDNSSIKLVYGGLELSDSSCLRLKEVAKEFGLENVALKIEHGLKTRDADLMMRQNSSLEGISNELLKIKMSLNEKNTALDSLTHTMLSGETILKEVSAFYQNIIGCSVSNSIQFTDSIPASGTPIKVVVFDIKGKLLNSEKQRVEAWLRRRLNDSLVVVKF
mgnify:FL=1